MHTLKSTLSKNASKKPQYTLPGNFRAWREQRVDFMLFMNTFQWESGKTDEIMQIRTTEKIPAGMKIIQEWIALDINMVYRLVEIEDPVALLKIGMAWADLSYTEMHPVMDAKDVMKFLI